MKKVLVLICALAMTLSLVACNDRPAKEDASLSESVSISPASETDSSSSDVSSFNLSEYEELISQAHYAIFDSSNHLSYLGSYELKYWEAGIKLSGSKQTLNGSSLEYAFAALKKVVGCSIDDLSSERDNIRKQYKEIFLIENDGSKEAVAVFNSYKQMYDYYEQFYQLVTNEHDTYSSFKSNLGFCANMIVSADSDLQLFIGCDHSDSAASSDSSETD